MVLALFPGEFSRYTSPALVSQTSLSVMTDHLDWPVHACIFGCVCEMVRCVSLRYPPFPWHLCNTNDYNLTLTLTRNGHTRQGEMWAGYEWIWYLVFLPLLQNIRRRWQMPLSRTGVNSYLWLRNDRYTSGTNKYVGNWYEGKLNDDTIWFWTGFIRSSQRPHSSTTTINKLDQQLLRWRWRYSETMFWGESSHNVTNERWDNTTNINSKNDHTSEKPKKKSPGTKLNKKRQKTFIITGVCNPPNPCQMRGQIDWLCVCARVGTGISLSDTCTVVLYLGIRALTGTASRYNKGTVKVMTSQVTSQEISPQI